MKVLLNLSEDNNRLLVIKQRNEKGLSEGVRNFGKK